MSPTFGIIILLYFSHSNGCMVDSHLSFNLLFPNHSNGASIRVLIYTSSLVKCYISVPPAAPHPHSFPCLFLASFALFIWTLRSHALAWVIRLANALKFFLFYDDFGFLILWGFLSRTASLRTSLLLFFGAVLS